MVNENTFKFMKSELKKAQVEVSQKESGREGVYFIIANNSYQLFIQSIDLDSPQRSIKISKQDLGELKTNLFIALVLIIDKEPKVLYLIPSKQLSKTDSYIFKENEVSLMPSLSNWEIKISSNTISELAKYSLENMVGKLKI